MLGPDDKLVQVARMLVVVDDIGHENSEDVQFLYFFLKVSNREEVMHSLHRVNDVHLIVERILLKVAFGHLKY